jgi:hypothetical protein
MTKAQLIKTLAADLKESAARNRMQREGGHIVEVDCSMSTQEYRAYGFAIVEYMGSVQVAVRCHAGLLTRETGNVEVISNLINNLLQ